MKSYYVYIATNYGNTVLYTGVTNNLQRRIYEHKSGQAPGFTKKYKINKVIFYEIFSNPESAIMAEKKIKGWIREKKLNLINNKNPNFDDLLKY